MPPSISGVGVSRRSLLPVSAVALLAVVATCWAHETRLLPAGASTRRFCRGPQALLLWHASAAAAQGCQTVLVTSTPGDEWQAVDHGIALFFGGPTPFLLALSKEMGSGKTRAQGRQPLAFAYFLPAQKAGRRQARLGLQRWQGPALAAMPGLWYHQDTARYDTTARGPPHVR